MPNPFSRTVAVDLGERAYDIVIGPDILDNAGLHIAPFCTRRRTVIVTDETVANHYGHRLEVALAGAGITSETVSIPPGEASKSFATLEFLVEDLLARDVERGDVILALGGGVVGDIAGFAASILRRGVDFIQIPTTLLAQVDSAVGGKTAINARQGKNLIGSFHQPRLVLTDVTLLDTLPERELRAGYAEIVKYGLINDGAFFTWLEENGRALLAGDTAGRVHAIARSCEAKARIVAADEREAGTRALLNLGHTFGHALEAAAGYDGRLLHGEGVAIGLYWAFVLSARLGHCAPADNERIKRHLEEVGLPTAPPPALATTSTALVDFMRQDKKMRDGKLTLVLAHGIGAAFLTNETTTADIAAMIEKQL